MRIAGGTVGSYILVTMKCFIPQTMTGSFKVAPKRFINMFSFVFRELKSVLIEISLVQGTWHNVILFLIMHPLFYKAASSGLFQLLWSVWLFYQTITCLLSPSLIWMWMCLEWMFDTTFTHTHIHAHPCTSMHTFTQAKFEQFEAWHLLIILVAVILLSISIFLCFMFICAVATSSDLCSLSMFCFVGNGG